MAFRQNVAAYPAARKKVTKCSSLGCLRTNLIHVLSCHTWIASLSALIAAGMFSETRFIKKNGRRVARIRHNENVSDVL